MLRNRISSRDDLIDYCMRANGAPVIELNIDSEQVEDLVDLAFEFYFDFHADATERTYYSHTLTQTDIDNKYISLPDNIVSAIKLFHLDSLFSKNIQYQSYISDVISQVQRGGTSSYFINNQHLNTINNIFNHEKSIRFNRNSNRLNIDTDWSLFNIDSVILVECFRMLDPEEFPLIYSEKWIIQYLTQLIKKQNAHNLRKYSGAQLPSGITLNLDSQYTEAVTELEKLEAQLREMFELPCCFFIG